MNEEIGIVAGQIWRLLKEQGEMSISSIVSGITAPQSTVYMALGWLAREDKLEFVPKIKGKTRGVTVKLK
jgi:hypothetical protein